VQRRQAGFPSSHLTRRILHIKVSFAKDAPLENHTHLLLTSQRLSYDAGQADTYQVMHPVLTFVLRIFICFGIALSSAEEVVVNVVLVDMMA
jgi:hypothetical protein